MKTINEIASILGVSERTIYRRMEEYGSKKLDFTKIDDKALDSIVLDTVNKFPRCGEVMIKEILKKTRVFIQRFRLRDSIKRLTRN